MKLNFPAPSGPRLGASPIKAAAIDQRGRKIGCLSGINVSQRHHLLARQCRVFDIDRAVEKTEPAKSSANLFKMAAELDDRGGFRCGEPGRDFAFRERRRYDAEALVARNERDHRSGGAGGQR